MKKFIFLLLIIHCSLLIAQTPIQEWVARIPGPNNDLFGPFLQVDKSGNSYIAGTHVENDTPKVLCVKYNTDGVQLWATLYIYPGEAYIRPSGLALDSSGNAYVIADQGPAYYLPTNGLIAKFNSINGSLVWAKRYMGEYGWGAFRDIKIDRLNNIYVAGWTDTSHLVIRYNTNGDSVWVRKYHPPSVRETARACTIDNSLNIIFTGHRILDFPPRDSLLVAKYSSGGVLRWESVYAYNNLAENVGTKIAADQNGSLYIGGVTVVSGFAVYLTLKYDRNGARQWAAIYDAPGSGNNELQAITMDRFNNTLYVTGMVSSANVYSATIKYNITTGDSIWVKMGVGSSYNNSGSWDLDVDRYGSPYITGAVTQDSNPADFLTLKYSAQGSQIWLVTYNGPFSGTDGGRALSLDTALNVYVLGYSQTSSTVSDYVLIKYSQFLGIQPVNNKIPVVFKLCQNFPNPFNPFTKIRLSIPKKSFIRIIIYDILGRIKEIPVNQQLLPSEYELTVDATDYASGTYFYLLIADGNIIDTKKFIVLK